MTYHHQAQAAPSDAGARTRSATRGATTRARSPRCAPAAAHDSISAAIMRGLLGARHRAAPRGQAVGHRLQLQDAGLLSRRQSHGFNTVHGRMPSGADRRQPGQPRPAVPRRLGRRRLGLDRPRASSRTRCAAACAWSTSSRTTASTASPRASSRPPPTAAARARRARSTTTPRSTWSAWRCSWAPPTSARGFSGDKAQLVPLIKGAIGHGGAAFIDVISPCVRLQQPRRQHQAATTTCASTTRR